MISKLINRYLNLNGYFKSFDLIDNIGIYSLFKRFKIYNAFFNFSSSFKFSMIKKL